MSAEPGGGQVESRRSPASLAFDLAVGALLFVGVTIGFSPWYSQRLFDRDAFRAYYDQGIYQFRILGPEVTLWLDRVIPNDPLGSHLLVNGRHPHASDLFTALVVLNGVSFLVIVVLVRSILRRTGVAEPGRSLVVVVFLVIVALSLSTVTPYDLPSIAVILAVLALASSRPPWDVLAAPALAVGVVTRESALVAIAALVAHAAVAPSCRRRTIVVASTAAAGVAAYLAVRIGASSPSFWEAVTLRGNVTRLIQWIGLGLMALAYLAWQQACAAAGLDGPAVRRALRWYWVVASPYVVTALVTGYWFEVRLLVPMVACELWLRCKVTAQEHDTDRVQSSRPLSGLVTRRSRSSTVTTPTGSS